MNKSYLPSYIMSKFNSKCSYCGENINKNEMIFYEKRDNKSHTYHDHCGQPEWKVKGSSYDLKKG